jgi:predicted secreted hydrolase
MKKMWKVLAPIIAAGMISCASTGPATGPAAYTAGSADEHRKLGLSPSRVETWEDGARTSGARGTYEWWYFDFSLDDGSTLVIVFLTKDFTRPQTPLTPLVTFTLDRPDGTNVTRAVQAAPSEFSAAKEQCDVRIGACSVVGDLRDYALQYEDAEVRADLRLHGTVPPWRPGTGHAFFGKGEERFFAWLPSVPQGTVEGTVTIAGVSRSVTGVGYHDHNWGNAPIPELVHHWYWGRARIGDYTVIASDITAAEAYGSVALPIFMLARGGTLVAEDATKVRVSADDLFTDPYTGKPVAGRIVYDYEDEAGHYRVTFRRATDLVRVRFIDILRGAQGFLAQLSCFDGAYLRFTGTATLERLEGEKVLETVSQKSAVWELMYFGHAPRGQAPAAR